MSRMDLMSIIVGILLISFLPIKASSQSTTSLNLEIITPENVQNLEELARWEHVNLYYPLADFSPDGSIIALALNDGRIQLLSTETLEVIQTIKSGDFSQAQVLQFSSDGARLAIYNSLGFILWDVGTGRILSQLEDDASGVFIPDYNFEQYYIDNYSDNSVSVYDIITLQEVLHIPHEFKVANKEGELIITADEDETVQVWNVSTGELVLQLSPYLGKTAQQLVSAGFTPDGNIWTNWPLFTGEPGKVTLYQSEIQFWNIATGEEIDKFFFEGGHWYDGLYFDPKERYIAAYNADPLIMSGGGLWFWDLQSNQEIPPRGVGINTTTAFSPASMLIADGRGQSIDDGRIYFFQVGETSYLHVLPSSGSFTTLKFSPDGKLLLNAGFEDVRLWGVLVN